MSNSQVIKKSLENVLQNLCKSQYLQKKKVTKFGKFGLNLKQNIVNTMTMSRIDLHEVENHDQALEYLKLGACAVTLQKEKNPGAAILKNLQIPRHEKNLLQSYEIVRDAPNTSFAYQNYLRRRRQFWKKYLYNSGQILVEENPKESKAVLKIKLQDFEEDINEVELESFYLMDEIREDWKVFHSTVDPSAGTMAVLLDCFRIQSEKRSFLALPNKIAPIPLGLVVKTNGETQDENIRIQELARFVQLLIKSENLQMLKHDSIEYLDQLGVPFIIEVDLECLKQAWIKVRDRESTLRERIHLTWLTPRMVHTFQQRKVPDTCYLVKKKYNLFTTDDHRYDVPTED